MYRFALDYIKSWKVRASRKPLVIRGARQVGKSFLAHMIAEKDFQNILEIDFERMPEMASFFSSQSPKTIVGLLETKFNTNILPGKTLLFLDEIQAAPKILAGLRYFYEEMPDLHIMAAGSLLEFVLEEHDFSMPVGRIEYLHMGPMQFEEFLLALGLDKLQAFLCNLSLHETVPDVLHSDLMRYFKQYLIVGGMPAAIQVFAKTGSYLECDAIKQSILSTYRDDFNKYRRRVPSDRLEKIFRKIPQVVGNKFKYSQVDREERSKDLKAALQALCLAKVAYPIHHSSCNGVPLGAELDDKVFKTLFLDVGLLCRSVGLNAHDFERVDEVTLVNVGSICEQFVGQHLLFSKEAFEEPELYYWTREKTNSNAEVDYVISVGPDIIPIEVKAGKAGTLKSLHMFLQEKNRSLGVRFNSEKPSLMETETNIAHGIKKPFRLLSLPLYLVGQTRRLCEALQKSSI